MPRFDASLSNLRWSLGTSSSRLGAWAGSLVKAKTEAPPHDPSTAGLSSIPSAQGFLNLFKASAQTAIRAESDDLSRLRASLSQIIDRKVVPLLLKAHESGGEAVTASLAVPASSVDTLSETAQGFHSEHLAAFIGHAMRGNKEACSTIVKNLLDAHGSLPRIYLELLAPAAREIGERWEDDRSSFTEVTLGVGQLQQLVLDLSPQFLGRTHHRSDELPKRILLSVCPGSAHTFGLTLVAEFMRAAGWQVSHFQQATSSELVKEITSKNYDMVGLSAGATVQIHDMRELISALRTASKDPAMLILVGGPAFAANAQWVIEVGADGSAADAQKTVELAEQLLRAKRPIPPKQE